MVTVISGADYVTLVMPSGDTTGATDAQAIQSAIAVAYNQGGGTVDLAGGLFITTKLTLPTGVKLRGSGRNATILQLANSVNDNLIETTNFSTLTGTDTTSTPYGFGVEAMTLDGNKNNQTGTSNALAIYGYGYRLDDVTIRNARNFGLWTEWGSASNFLLPDGPESFVTEVKLHDNDGGTIRYCGPHDTQFINVIAVQNSGSATAAVEIPTDGRGNGGLFVGLHVYGGAYSYGVDLLSSGLTFVACQIEGASIAQVLCRASINYFEGCKLFWGSSGANTTKGMILGDSTHTNINSVRVHVKVENCSGGALDLTYAGGGNFYDVSAVCISPFTVPSPAVVGSFNASDTVTFAQIDNAGAATSDSFFQYPHTLRTGTTELNVQLYGATGNGTTDDTAAIQAVLNSASAGQTVYLGPGVYRTSAPLTLPSGVILRGAGGQNASDAGDVGTVIKPLAGFSGTSVLYLADVGASATYGGSILNLSIDGVNATATIDGIRAFGPVKETVIRDVSISRVTGWGINTTVDGAATGPQWPFMWDVSHVMLDTCAAGGLSLTSMTDATFSQVYVLYCGQGTTKGPGWSIVWAGNSTFEQCRAEWCGTDGWHLTGAWWTGTGAGGMTMTACSTDRNEQHGLLIDATGNGPVVIDGLMLRRDGRNAKSGGGSYAGLSIASATIPVMIGTVSVFPGVDDDGTGTNSPQYGVSIAGSPLLTIQAGYIQAATAAVNDTHSGGYVWMGPGIITATGTPASPGSYTGQTSQGYQIFNGAIYANAGIDIDVAGQGLAVKEGANAKQGTATLNGTTNVVVANTSVTANSRIFLTIQSRGSVNPPGSPYVVTRTAGTSFTIASTVASDNSVVAYEIVEPG